MNRYSASNTTKPNNLEKLRLTTCIFPELPAATTDILIRTTSIERLDKLAQRFYGDPTAWPVIASANPLLKGTLVIPTNTRLRIPAATRVQEFLNNININR